MISETRERFLRAIVATVQPEQIAEIHFFQPIKQGGVESGVAVVAAGETVGVAAALRAPAHHAAADDGATAEPAGAADAPHEAYAVRTPEDLGAHAHAAAPGEESAAEEPDATLTAGVPAPSHDHPAPEPLVAEGPDEGAHAAGARAVPLAAPSMTDDIPTTAVLDDLASGEEPAGEGSAEAEVEEESAPHRFTVFTARYRLVLKGIDRGKWEASVVAEADAPLLTVDAVVRGVHRRSGDVDDAERMSGDEIRRELARMDAADAVKASARTPGSR